MKLKASRAQDLADISRMLGAATEQDMQAVSKVVSQYLSMAKGMLAQLKKRFGSITKDIRATVTKLSFPLLNDLMVSTLDFESLEDLRGWLQANPGGTETSVGE